MSTLKIATWNVNSLRVRLQHLLDWLAVNQPDIVALQEIKLPNEVFPLDELKAAGYHSVFAGQKAYNGVAILAKQPLTEVPLVGLPTFQDDARRLLAITIQGIRIINVYVPNGQSVGSEKYEYKLAWLHHLQQLLITELALYPKLVVLGDFNIAPQDLDVYNPKRFVGKILCSEGERNAFQELLSTGLQDSYRMLHPEGQDHSWWDYRLDAFTRGWGFRIDLILLSHALIKQCVKAGTEPSTRALIRPSDHAPVCVELQL